MRGNISDCFLNVFPDGKIFPEMRWRRIPVGIALHFNPFCLPFRSIQQPHLKQSGFAPFRLPAFIIPYHYLPEIPGPWFKRRTVIWHQYWFFALSFSWLPDHFAWWEFLISWNSNWIKRLHDVIPGTVNFPWQPGSQYINPNGIFLVLSSEIFYCNVLRINASKNKH